MLKNLLLAGLVILMAAGLTIGVERYFKKETADFFILEQGKTIPDFEFTALDGQTYNYYDFINQPTVIHFWASWCAPCVVEFPDIMAFAKSNPEVTVLAFSTDRTKESINRFLQKHAPDRPDNVLIIHDKDGLITQDKFSVFALPESFLAAKDGRLDSHLIGAYKDWETINF